MNLGCRYVSSESMLGRFWDGPIPGVQGNKCCLVPSTAYHLCKLGRVCDACSFWLVKSKPKYDSQARESLHFFTSTKAIVA